MIDCLSGYRSPITANCPITLSTYNCTEWLVKYKEANASITFKEIVMVIGLEIVQMEILIAKYTSVCEVSPSWML